MNTHRADRFGLANRMTATVGPMLAAILLVGAVPTIDLDTRIADAMVRVSDTAYWGQMPFLCLAAVVMLISRPGLDTRRRAVEAGAVIVALVVVLAGNGLFNEYVVKPAIGIPRPNIVELAEAGTLGADIGTGDAFYALGDKDERRAVLADRLTPETTPELSELVRAHWIHEAGYAMPSGHTTTAVAFATMWAGFGVAWMSRWRRWITSAVVPIWAVAVTYSRWLLGVHTALDLIIGGIVGIGWGLATILVIRKVVESRGAAPP